jgi:hypothetical protein
MNYANLLKPGLHYVHVEHDDGCPAIESQSDLDCTCRDARMVEVTQNQFIAAAKMNRQQRRAAERAAHAAIRKAARRGGAR